MRSYRQYRQQQQSQDGTEEEGEGENFEKTWRTYRGQGLGGRKKFFSQKTGEGLNLTHDDRIVKYVYFDDCNELVDRFRLILSEKRAGNNSYDNEILSIVEELRERGIVTNTPTPFRPNF